MQQEKNSGINRKFCERIRDRRLRLGLNSQDYADLLGVSRSRLGNWEAQINSAPRSVISGLAARLNVSDTWLAGEDDVFLERPPQVLQEASHPFSTGKPNGIQAECLAHLEAFLAACRGRPEQLGWTLVHLREEFPLDRWKDAPEPTDQQLTNAATGGAAHLALDGAAASLGLKQKAASTSGKGGGLTARVPQKKGVQTSPPTPVPAGRES